MILLSEIIAGLETVSDITDVYYNPETEETFLSDIGDFEDLDEDELDELFEKSIMLPTRYEINEYEMMEEFIETKSNNTLLYNQLCIAINGPGAFRRFKDTCINFDIIDKWYKFRDAKYRELAIEWCNEHNIKYKED